MTNTTRTVLIPAVLLVALGLSTEARADKAQPSATQTISIEVVETKGKGQPHSLSSHTLSLLDDDAATVVFNSKRGREEIEVTLRGDVVRVKVEVENRGERRSVKSRSQLRLARGKRVLASRSKVGGTTVDVVVLRN